MPGNKKVHAYYFPWRKKGSPILREITSNYGMPFGSKRLVLTDGRDGRTRMLQLIFIKPNGQISPGLSLRAGGRGFSPATKTVAPGYFYWKIEQK